MCKHHQRSPVSLGLLGSLGSLLCIKFFTKNTLISKMNPGQNSPGTSSCYSWTTFVKGITLCSLSPLMWNKSKGKTVFNCKVVKKSSLVVNFDCHCAYTNENSDNGNQKKLRNVLFLLNKNRPQSLYCADV